MLYLVQHAEANSADKDPRRDLSEVGIGHARTTGAFLAARGVRPERIWHSGKLRAEHTARIIAEAVRVEEVLVHEELSPGDDPRGVAREVEEIGDVDVMIVGHLPYLERLTASLLGASSDRSPVRFRNSGVTALSRREGAWAVDWSIPPEMMQKEPDNR